MQSPAKATFLRIGTRGSPLALYQARLVRQLLSEHHGVEEDRINIQVIKTEGDKTQAGNVSLKEIGGKGLFSKEIEAALVEGRIDIGVHSAKDMATALPDGLVMPVFLEREDPRDAFISLKATTLEGLPEGARIGTSSLRRAAQLRFLRPDVEIVEFRGNVDTRLQKLRDNVADATFLALAGLKRLGKQSHVSSILDPDIFPTAPAQGAIGIEYRASDDETAKKLTPLNHLPTFQQVGAERALLARLDGSCRTPIGVHTIIQDGLLTMSAEVLSPDGTERHRETVAGLPVNAGLLGNELGLALIDMAGQAFFDRLKGL